ncbi:epidermal growth factor-like protein 8 [Antedon mediterranea]|uniref:epidermal growth factor-like protein 8 n=1 Tax=Antedon mediterranea TaxID=105859 RepID=UPI003AF681B1
MLRVRQCSVVFAVCRSTKRISDKERLFNKHLFKKILMNLFVLILLSIPHVIISVPTAGRPHVCSRKVSSVHSVTVSYSVSYSTRYYSYCGVFGWGRCTAYRTKYRREYRKEYRTTYSTNYFCCSGWAESGNGGCSIPICNPSCKNKGQCVSPSNCDCPDTYTGSRCEIDVNECDVGIDRCDQGCHNSIGSFSCSCRQGWSLDQDKKSCTDVNECDAGIDGCEQHCSNSIGSFSCYCMHGWKLNPDNKSCTGMKIPFLRSL